MVAIDQIKRYLRLCFEIHHIHTLKGYLIKGLSSNWQNFSLYIITFLIPHSSYYSLFLKFPGMVIGVHVSFWIMVFSIYMPIGGLLDHMVALFLVFWIKKMWLVYAVEYYTAIRRNKIGLFVETWMYLSTVIQGEIREREKQILYINIYVEPRTMGQMTLLEMRM